MGRKRIYSNPAERQKAYRERLSPERTPPPPLPVRKRKVSRPARLCLIEQQLQDLLDEYIDWQSQIPESLVDSAQAGLLAQTIDELTEIVESIANVNPPRGFGRD